MPRILYKLIAKRAAKGVKYASGFFVAVGIFLALSIFMAWGTKLNTDSAKLFPKEYKTEASSALNWTAPENALTLDLDADAVSDEFNTENSAHIKEISTGSDSTEEDGRAASVEFSAFSLSAIKEKLEKENIEKNIEISDLKLVMSLAAFAQNNKEGELTVEVTVNGKTKHKIAEIGLDKHRSNSINEGYYEFSLEPLFGELKGKITSKDVENLRVFLSIDTVSEVYIDALWLQMDFAETYAPQHRPKVKLKNGENISVSGSAFSPEDNPSFTVSSPELSLKELKVRVENEEIEVLEDKFRVLTKKNIVFEMLEEEKSEIRNPKSETNTNDKNSKSKTEEVTEKIEQGLGRLLKQEEEQPSATSPKAVEGENNDKEDSEETRDKKQETDNGQDTNSNNQTENTELNTELTPILEQEESLEDEAGEQESDGDTEEASDTNLDTEEDSDNPDNVDNKDNQDTSDKDDQKEPEPEQEQELEPELEPEPEPETETETETETSEENTTEVNNTSYRTYGNFFEVKEALAQSASVQDLSFYLVNPRGERTEANVNVSRYFEGSQEKFDIEVEKPERNFIPGKYTLEAELEMSESIIVLQQDFSWGVLAINFNKSIYTVNSEQKIENSGNRGDTRAYIQMGVLDDVGHTICDAELELQVTTPENKISIFQTKDGSIKSSQTCAGDSVNPEPDYFVNYSLGDSTGTYTTELTATTENGTRTVQDSFEVRDSVPFDVEREGPTRIYPVEPYEMHFNITANEDFEGEIVETVPESFVVTNAVNSEQRTVNNEKQISWQVDLKAGESYDLSYEFDALNESPRFYLLGPLEFYEQNNESGIKNNEETQNSEAVSQIQNSSFIIRDSASLRFSEARQWQIASDAVLPTIYVDGAAGDGDNDANGDVQNELGTACNSTTCATSVDISGGQDDSTYVVDANNATGTRTQGFQLDDMPADFANMDSATATFRLQDAGTATDDTLTLNAQLVEANGTTALSGLDTVHTHDGTTAFTEFTVSFSNLNTTAGAATWNGAELELTWDYTRTKGPDDLQILVSGVQIEGEYTQAVTPIDISGSTDAPDGTTVAVAVNGTRQAETTTTSGGAWTISNVTQPASGDVITVWLDGVADESESTAVTKYTGTGNITGMELDSNVLSIGTTGGYADQSLTVGDLGLYDADSGSDGGDEDVMHTANSGTLDVEGSTNSYTDESIRIETGDTLTIGDTEILDTHNTIIDGTLTSGGAGTFTVSGSWDNNSVFQAASEAVTFTSTVTGETIDSTGATDADFNGIIFNGSGGEWTINSALTINTDLTMTAGTLLGAQDVTVNGGNVTGDGDINLTGGTFTLDGAGNFGGATAWDFNSLTIGGDGTTETTTATGAGSIVVADTLTIGANQTLDAGSKTWTLNGTGTPFVINGVFTPNASTFDYTGTGATNITATTYNNLESSAAATVTHTLASGTVATNGNFTIGNGTDPQTVDADNFDPTLTVGGNLTINSNAELLASGTATFEVAGSWTNSGTFTNNGGSVTFNAGSGSVNIDSTGAALDDFNNVVFDDGGGPATFLLESALDVNGDLTITGGTLDANGTENNQINVGGNWTNNDIFEAQNGLIVLDGLTSATLDAGCTAFNDCANGNFFDLEINKTDGGDANDNVTLTSTDISVANTLTITDGELVQGALNAQIEGTTTSVSISSAGEWFNTSTGDLILDGDFINNGTATFNANGTTCGDADDITITNISNIPDWDGTGSFSMKDITISNQNAVASITVESGTNDGGNTGNWTFSGCSVTIEGNVLQSDEGTFIGNPPCDGSTAVVSMRINGGTESTTTCDSSTGLYTFSGIFPNAGDVITVYLNGNSTPKANLVMAATTADVLNADLYRDTVIVRDEDDSTISISDMTAWDSTDDATNMLFDAATGTPDTLIVNSDVELHIFNSDTFDPGGTVTTQGTAGDVHVDDSATMHIDEGSSAISGDVLVDGSATFNVNADVSISGGDITTSGTGATVSYSGTPTVTISGTGSIGGGTTPSITFYNLVISGTQTMASATTTDNDLTVNGTMDGSASITTLASGDITGSGTVNMTGGEVEQRVSATSTFATSSGTNTWTFNDLTFSNSDGGAGHNIITHTGGSGPVVVNNILFIGDGADTQSTTLDAGNRTWEIAGTGGDPFQILDSPAGALNGQSSTFEYTGDNGGGDTTVEDASFNNLTFTGAETYVPEGTVSAANDLTVNTNATLGGTQDVTVNGNATGEGSIDLAGGLFHQRISEDKNFGASSGANTWTFNDLTFSNSSGSTTSIISAQTGGTGPVVVAGTMLVSDTGDSNPTRLNAGDKTYELTNANAQNPLDIDLAGGILDAQTSTFIYAGDFDAGDVHIEDASYYNLTLGGPVAENYNPSEAAITASNDLLINANATLVGTNNVTVNHNATGSGSINHTGGTFEVRVSAAATFGTSSSANSWSFNNLRMSNASTTDHTITANAGGTGEIIVNSSFTIGPTGDTNGTTFDNETNDRILDINNMTIDARGLLTASSTASFTVSGNWVNDGTLNEGTGTVEFDGTTSASIDSGCTDKDNCTSENFYDVVINKTSGTDADDNITLSNQHLRVTNTLTITDGELIQGDRDVRAEAASANTAITVASGVSAGWTNTSSGDLTLGGAFDAGDGTITFEGEGSACGGADTILLRSTDGATQRLWDVSGGPTLSFNDVDVADQGATGTITVFSGTDNGGNDANWTFQGCALTNTFSMRPDGDVTPMNWTVVGSTCAGEHWCTVNDNVDDPTAASFTERIEGSGNVGADRFTTASPTDVATGTQLIPKIYMDAVGGNANMDVTMEIFINSTTSLGTQTFSAVSASASWYSMTPITGSWTQADIDSLEIELTAAKNGGGQADTVRVAATYVELTYDQQGIRIQGNAFENETATALTACDGTTTMITAVSASTTFGPIECADADGSFEFVGVTQPTGGDPVIVYIDDVASTFGTALVRYGGDGNITGVDVRRDRLTMRHDDVGPVDNTDLGTWDNADDTDIVYNVDDVSDDITLENGTKLIVNAGEDYTPGASVTTDPSSDGTDTNIDGDILIKSSASMNMGANSLSVGGDFENQGSFTKSTGQTTTFTATATGHTITDGGSNFENITFNGTGGGWSFADAVILDGDLTMTNGTLSGTSDITVAGGDIAGGGTINLTGGNVLLANSDGTGNLGGGSYTFNNLTIGDGDGTPETAQLAGDITVSDTLTIANTDVLDGNTNTITLSGTGTPFVINGSFTVGTSTVDYTGTSATNITATTYYNLESSPAVTATHTLESGTVNVDNIFTVGNGTDPVTVDANTNDPTVDITGELLINAGAEYSASDSGTFRIAGDFTNNGTFTNNSGQVIFYTTNTSTIAGSGTVFNDFQSTTDDKTLLFTSGETFQIDGFFNIQASSSTATISINSSDGTNQWFINHQGTEDLDFVSVENSGCDASSTDIDAFTTDGNVDSGNNDFCWIFVPFEVSSQNWQWFSDTNTATPQNAMAGENTAPSGTNNGEDMKLRFTIAETAGGLEEDIRYKLQFSTQSDFSSGVSDVEDIGSCTGGSGWCYADGFDEDDAPIEELILTDSDTAGVHNESSGASTFDHPANAAVEMEFTLEQSGASVDTTYFFRAFDTKNNEAVPLNTGESYPSITTGGTTLSFSINGLPDGTSTEGITTTVSTSSTAIPFGQLSFDSDERAAHRLDVTTNAASGYSVFMYQRQSLLNHAGAAFTPFDGTNSEPSAWNTGCPLTAAGCYGYHTGDDSLSGDATRFSPDDSYAQFNTSSEEVAFSSVPVTNELTDMVYRIEARNRQESGDYETQLVYIIVPVF